MSWKPTHLLEGMEEVWITFTNEETDEEVTVEVASVDDVVYQFIGGEDEVRNKVNEAKEEMVS